MTPADRAADRPDPRSPEICGDATTTLSAAKRLIEEFVDQRDWHRFHSPKNLTMALAIEVAELMEHFQWISPEESRKVVDQPEKLTAVGEELADVIGYSLAIANELGLDVASILADKMVKNRRKYPADEYRGRYEKES